MRDQKVFTENYLRIIISIRIHFFPAKILFSNFSSDFWEFFRIRKIIKIRKTFTWRFFGARIHFYDVGLAVKLLASHISLVTSFQYGPVKFPISTDKSVRSTHGTIPLIWSTCMSPFKGLGPWIGKLVPVCLFGAGRNIKKD